METSGSNTILVISSIGDATEERRPEPGIGSKLVSNVAHSVRWGVESNWKRREASSLPFVVYYLSNINIL